MTVRGKIKAKVKVAPKTTQKNQRVIRLSDNRLADSVVTIGFEASGVKSARSLKLREAELKARVGGKASGLVRMMDLKLPVPPAFNLSTELCGVYLRRQNLPAIVLKKCQMALEGLEKKSGKKLGGTPPLLLSVRSGARVSMPGMMDTILNLGLNTEVVQKVARQDPDKARFWWDCYRRLISMFADVVLDIHKDEFENLLHREKNQSRVDVDSELSVESLRKVCEDSLLLIERKGKKFPQNPWDQMVMAVEAVFRSWNSDRAVHYRRLNKISEDWGTSVTIQSMVFGNLNEKSGTGVVFTRDPSTGKKELYGEYLLNAQGEDVVAGIRTPQPISTLKAQLPKVYTQLAQILSDLEKKLLDVQDVEFTVEDGKLFILQTRSAKRTAAAAIEHLVQFVSEKRLNRQTALKRFSYDQVKQLLHPSLKPTHEKPLGKGLPASPGAVSGIVAFDPETAQTLSKSQRVILVRRETSPEDIMGMAVAEGILTSTGGMTSHAAVVGRGMGKSCVVGCTDLKVDEAQRKALLGGVEIREGTALTLNGSTGEIYLGELPTEAVSWSKAAQSFFSWADEHSKMKVLANADTPEQARNARMLGAQGIGLCRTEHMFFEADRLRSFRKMILAEESDLKQKALDELLPHQKDDFRKILEAMKGLSVCVRLLDPPLHEFLPKETDKTEIESLSRSLDVTPSRLISRIHFLHEQNPMLGHRGCRLAITNPEIYLMQTEALARALVENFRNGVKTQLKIMIPLIIASKELEVLLLQLKSRFEEVLRAEDSGHLHKWVKWGTMIEIPRACLVAGEIASQVDFFSFGTNDLTQATLGLSRDDASKFLPAYIEKRILSKEPFESLDTVGVGELIQWAVTRGRKANKALEIGICGEHGGDPESITFFDGLKFDSVSCSPYRVPVARLAAARAPWDASKD